MTSANHHGGVVMCALAVGSLQINFTGNWLDWLINLFKVQAPSKTHPLYLVGPILAVTLLRCPPVPFCLTALH